MSVVIATYNRFYYLMNTIKSIKAQTYKNIEIIVVNDCSTQKEYYDYDIRSTFLKLNKEYFLPYQELRMIGGFSNHFIHFIR